MLRASGLEDLVAADAAGYVDKAVGLGRDDARRRDASQRIVAGRGALFGRDEPIRALEDFLARAARGG
jgi:predicted O-linked N-acetylglucosamine transferase (SPINDLY family)